MQLRAPDRDPIRVLLGPMPDLLRGMIDDLLSIEPDMVVLGRSEEPAEALESACRDGADMLIVQAKREKPDDRGGLLQAMIGTGPLSIFAISESGEDATAVRLVQEAVAFDASSSAALAAAIRRIARSRVPFDRDSRWPA